MTVELSESALNGRFSAHAKPLVAPGKCACCGSVTKPVVDFGFTVEFYGAVLLCGECIREAHALLSVVFPESVGSQAQVVPLPTLNVEAINAYVLDATESINHLRRILPDAILHSEDAKGVPSLDEVLPVFATGESARATHSHDESVSVEGPNDGPSTNGIFNIK